MNQENLNDVSRTTEGLLRNRIAAKNAGDTKYFTNKPCHKGHITYRYVASGMCAMCASGNAKKNWAVGKRQNSAGRSAVNKRWNDSGKAREAKHKWRENNPKRAWAVYVTGGAKTRAALKQVPFDLTSDYVESITTDVCPVFGTPFTFIGNKKIGTDSASLDRLNPAAGYVIGNVVVVSVKANMIKSAYGSADIAKVAEWLKKKGY